MALKAMKYTEALNVSTTLGNKTLKIERKCHVNKLGLDAVFKICDK